MTTLQIALYTISQIRQLEQLAINTYGISEAALMERAGAAALQRLRDCWPDACKIAVVCGRGNNAGDGYVLARLARQQQLQVILCQVGELDDQKGLARQQAERCRQAGLATQPWTENALTAADVVVDALLGIGLQGEVRAPYRQAIAAINCTGKPVLALDVPSGLQADTGNVMGEALRAHLTVTFIGLKPGLYTGQGVEYSGQVMLEDLALPAAAYEHTVPNATLLTETTLPLPWSKRSRTAHKGHFGHVLVIGGDYGMAGAVRLAAEAAARVGAGLVSVATRAEHIPIVTGVRPELMCHAVTSPHELAPLLAKATVIVIGPGLGQSEWGRCLLAAVLQAPHPKILDADALNLLAANPLMNPPAHHDWVLTPHPGEAARLLRTTTAQIQADRWAAAQALQQRYGGVVVLKGAGTIVQAGKNQAMVCTAGNPGMASGGMGDILSGIIAGLRAQQLDLSQAAQLGVYWHARAADEVVATTGERGLLALDLLPQVRRLVNAL